MLENNGECVFDDRDDNDVFDDNSNFNNGDFDNFVGDGDMIIQYHNIKLFILKETVAYMVPICYAIIKYTFSFP
jgi:hypothetical protein